MDTVTESKMAIAIAKLVALELYMKFRHKKTTNEIIQVKEKLFVGAAVGLYDDIKRAKSLVDGGCDLIVIDTAHGHSGKVLIHCQN